MKIGEVKDAKNNYTSKTSDVVRQLAFAGIAVIWLVRPDSSKAIHPIPSELTPVLALFGVALACDLLHYAASSLIWSVYYRIKIRENLSENTPFEEPYWLPLPGWFFFVLKVLLLLVGWGWLAIYLVIRWQMA
jgi:hypothetical protein